MFGKIIYISATEAHVATPENVERSTDLMNMHVIFEDNDKKIIGEV